MPHFMLDTDISAFILRGPSESLRTKLLDTPLAEQSISVVTLAELLYGVRLPTRPEQNREAFGAFLRHLTFHPWADSAAEHYADIRAQLKKRPDDQRE
jgi:tRNA(fMet)-specific endonuclease VapC